MAVDASAWPLRFAAEAQRALTAAEAILGSPARHEPHVTERPLGKQTVELQATMSHWPDWGDLRTVYIFSPKLEIYNQFFFPVAARGLPIYAMEYVRTAGRPIVAVVDLPWELPAEARPALSPPLPEQMASIQAAVLPELCPSTDFPEWYAEARSGYDLFYRPAEDEAFVPLLQAHAHCWELFLSLIEATPTLPDATADAHWHAVCAYQDHHRLNSPGLPLLHRVFGEAWTDEFMRTKLFRPVDKRTR